MGDIVISLDDSSDDDLNDFVTLGNLTEFKTKIKWKFPQTSHCPMCGISCSSRNVALVHFQDVHADTSMVCVACDMLFDDATKVLDHYSSQHPNRLPPELKKTKEVKKNIVQSQQNDTSDESEEEEDDLITLSGCDITTQWRFPEEMKCCPEPHCWAEFGVRSDAIRHYKKRHANHSIVCPACVMPIMCTNGSLSDFRTHYNHIHPNDVLPYGLDADVKPQTTHATKNARQIEKTKINSDTESEDSETDDLITLSGCGETTHWRFPQHTKICPVQNCKIEFGVRSDAIDHYKKKHACRSILCPICVKPISARRLKDFQSHYKSIHRTEKFPYGLCADTEPQAKKTAKDDESKKDHSTDSDDDEEDDLITLHGCGRTTHWRFPQKIKSCPVRTCRVEFGVRSDAIRHYKKRHASRSIFCPICIKPICACRLVDFKRHYKRKHPNRKLPYNLVSESFKKSLKKDDFDMYWQNADEVDDLIMLNGLGETTFWQFPKRINHCPVLGCGLTFPTRSEAIAHYKVKHANQFILCSICLKPISTRKTGNLKAHYQSMHPDTELPTFTKDRATRSTEQLSGKKKETVTTVTNDKSIADQSEDDLITLNGCGRITKWRFSKDLKQCPVSKCNLEFETRQEAIVHYKMTHAKNSIFCALCDKPICTDTTREFLIHYGRMHPNEKVPFNLGEAKKPVIKIVPCEICGKKMLANNISKHIKDIHNPETFVCPLMGCEHDTKRLSDLRRHWNNKHHNLRFPEIRKGSEHTYKVNTPKIVKQESQETSNASVQKEVSNTRAHRESPEIQDSPTGQDDIESNENLLIPLRTASEPSSSDEEINLRCVDCNYVSKTVFALKMHREIKHNVLKKRLKKRIKRRISSSGSTTESDDIQAKKAVKRRRLVKKRVHGNSHQDSFRDEARNLERLEDQKRSLEQQELRDTSPFPPLISVQTDPEKIIDPLEFDQPLDLSIPKMICVTDSKDVIILIDSEDDVKPTITLDGISNRY